MSKLVVVRIGGQVNLNADIIRTLELLNLQKKHACVIVESDKPTLGMLLKVKDYITWGQVSEQTLKALEAKRKENTKVIHLHPPIGGFERKGIKKSYKVGGALGPREQDMDVLIKKMLV